MHPYIRKLKVWKFHMAILLQIHTICAKIETVHKGLHSSEQPCHILCRQTTEYTPRISFGSDHIFDLIAQFTSWEMHQVTPLLHIHFRCYLTEQNWKRCICILVEKII